MSLGKWFLGLIQHVITDAVLRRPIDVTLRRGADGQVDIKTSMRPSGQQPPTTVVYGGYPPPGYLPAHGYPPVTNERPQQVNAGEQPPIATTEAPQSFEFPEDFKAR